jgi:hypothetical protein
LEALGDGDGVAVWITVEGDPAGVEEVAEAQAGPLLEDAEAVVEF